MNERAREMMQQALPTHEIGGELGRGAFGVVYEGRHTQLGRQVAIKQLPQSFAENDDVRDRFVAEAQMVASLEHPHIVPVYDFVESDGSRFMIMERCTGSIGDRFKSEGIVTDEACAAMLACLAALDFAHAKGMLHRDVKPENLMYDAQGVVKLADFGIARDLGLDTRRTATGMIIGTPAYMSPEQCRGDDLTPASDVYSVAMMGYELMTGVLPFPHTDSVNGLLAHHLVTAPTPLLQSRPELPGSVGEVIDRALAKDLDVRYASAEEFATALARSCVTAFGSGWLRRRRFVLHWPAIIAESERPDSNSPRTGTIMVRAGDAAHAVVAAAEQLEPTNQMEPQPVASVGSADAPTLPEQQPAPATSQPPLSASGETAITPPPSAPAIPPSADSSPSDGPNWALVGGLAAVIAAIVVGVVLFAGGGSGGDTSVTVTRTDAAPTDADTAAETRSIPETEPTAAAQTAEPTAAPPADPTAAALPEPTPVPEPAAATASQPEQPLVLGSNGNPIMNRLPLEFDDRTVDSPWAATPCPLEQRLVACIFAVVDATAEEDDNIEVAWFTLGFTPELEPTGHHLHFYIPELIGGDETKAGTSTPGGAWRIWDGPWPATSFGGDSGRTLYTMADFRAAGSNTLCLIVATPEHEAIPGTGNCAPVVSDSELDADFFRAAADRLEGGWIGDCSTRAMAIAPDGWRWYDLNKQTPAEIAAEIRPTMVAETTALLQDLQDQGGVVWAEGPVEGDFIVNFSMTLVPGDFDLTDGPAEVTDALARLGIPASQAGERTVAGRSLYFGQPDVGGGLTAPTFIVPDHGYAIVFTLTAPVGLGYGDLADQIAYTIQGC